MIAGTISDNVSRICALLSRNLGRKPLRLRAKAPMIASRYSYVFADGGYAGDKLRQALRRIGKWTLEIVKRSDTAKGFVVLPRRWVVERTLAWLNRNRRLAKDFEQTIASATAWLFIASIQLFARRIARL